MQIHLLFDAGLKENEGKENKIGRKIIFTVWLSGKPRRKRKEKKLNEISNHFLSTFLSFNIVKMGENVRGSGVSA